MIVDLFAGPGGWSEGLKAIGLHDLGIEWDEDACATRAAAGHLTMRADVSEVPTGPFEGKVTGLIASPPCQAFSMAGKGAGRADRRYLVSFVDHFAEHGWTDPSSWHTWDDPRTPLILEPLRWVQNVRPEWVALEQVPPVIEIWKEYAKVWKDADYSVWCGVLNCADYGVPQTRNRAVLLASRVRKVFEPQATHDEHPQPSLLGDELLPWITMGDALGWQQGRVGFPRRDDLGTSEDGYRERDWRDVNQPSFALTEKARSWVWERPATTIAGDPRCWPPGHKINSDDRRRLGDDEAEARYGDRAGTEAIRLEIHEALRLQTFDPAYPVQGSMTSQFLQVGNAVPPLLAASILPAVVGLDVTEVAA